MTKQTKIINLNHENINKLIGDPTLDTCKNCKISIDVSNLLKNILETPIATDECLSSSCRQPVQSNHSKTTAQVSSQTFENNKLLIGNSDEELQKNKRINGNPMGSSNAFNTAALCDKARSRSKSLDDISTSSNEIIEGVDSVELIFISDEFLNKMNKRQSEVIIVDDPFGRKPVRSTKSQQSHESSEKKVASKKSPKLYVISDDFKNKSLNNTVVVVKRRDHQVMKKERLPSANHPNDKLSINLKTTNSNSNTFLTYEEPWSPGDDLEEKNL